MAEHDGDADETGRPAGRGRAPAPHQPEPPPLELAEDPPERDPAELRVTSAGDASADDLKRLDRRIRRLRRRRALRVELLIPFLVVPFIGAIALCYWAHQSALTALPAAMDTLLAQPFGFDRDRISAAIGWHPRLLLFWLLLVGGACALAALPDRLSGARWPGALLLAAGAAGAWFLPAETTRQVLAGLPTAPMRHLDVAAQTLPGEFLLVGALATLAAGWYAGRSGLLPWTLLTFGMAAAMAWFLAEARLEALEATMREMIGILNRGGAPRPRQLGLLADGLASIAIPLHARALADALLLLTPWWVASRISRDVPLPGPEELEHMP